MHKLFKNFQSDRMLRFMASMRGYREDNLRFPKVGAMVEEAIAIFSNGSLVRINQTGKDLRSTKGKTTVESKITQFKNKCGMDVRGVVLKNRRQSGEYEDILADLFVFPDVVNGKMAVVSSERIYNIKDNGATVTASVDCEPQDFLFFGYKGDSHEDYFEVSEQFDRQFIQSF